MGLKAGDAKKIAACWAVLFTGGVAFFFVAKKDVDKDRAKLLENTKRHYKRLEAERDAAEEQAKIVLEASDQKKQ